MLTQRAGSGIQRKAGGRGGGKKDMSIHPTAMATAQGCTEERLTRTEELPPCSHLRVEELRTRTGKPSEERKAPRRRGRQLAQQSHWFVLFCFLRKMDVKEVGSGTKGHSCHRPGTFLGCDMHFTKLEVEGICHRWPSVLPCEDEVSVLRLL